MMSPAPFVLDYFVAAPDAGSTPAPTGGGGRPTPVSLCPERKYQPICGRWRVGTPSSASRCSPGSSPTGRATSRARVGGRHPAGSRLGPRAAAPRRRGRQGYPRDHPQDGRGRRRGLRSISIQWIVAYRPSGQWVRYGTVVGRPAGCGPGEFHDKRRRPCTQWICAPGVPPSGKSQRKSRGAALSSDPTLPSRKAANQLKPKVV